MFFFFMSVNTTCGRSEYKRKFTDPAKKIAYVSAAFFVVVFCYPAFCDINTAGFQSA